MNFNFKSNTAKSDNSALIEEIKGVCMKSVLFEELIANLIELPVALEMITFESKQEKILAIRIIADKYSDPKEFGHIFLNCAKLKKQYVVRTIPGLCNTKDSKAARDDAWYDQRDKRLRVKYTMHHAAAFAAPSSLPELILSYVLKPGGSAKVSRVLEAADDYVPHFCARLKLACLFSNPAVIQHETFFIRLDRLNRLIEKRVTKKELQSGAVVLN